MTSFFSFIGLNETNNIGEGIRHLILCEPSFSLIFFKNLTSISSRRILIDLASSKPFPKISYNKNIPTPYHFLWCCYCFAKRFNAKIKTYQNPVLLIHELNSNKSNYKLFKYLESGVNNNGISSKYIAQFILNNRTLFFFLDDNFNHFFPENIDRTKIMQFFSPYDLKVRFRLLKNENNSIQALLNYVKSMDNLLDPEVFKNLFQSAIEIKTDRLIDILNEQFYFKDDKYLSLINSFICDKEKHFIDVCIQLIEPFVLQRDVNSIERFFHSYPVLEEIFIVPFLKNIPNNNDKLYFEIFLPYIVKYENYTKIPIISYYQNLLWTLENIERNCGISLSFNALEDHSIVYYMTNFIYDLDPNFVFSLNTSVDYSFFLYNLAIYTYLRINGRDISNKTSKDNFQYDFSIIIECIQRINDQYTQQSLLKDLFSLMFLKNGRRYITNINVVRELIPIIQKYSKDQSLSKYATFAQNKIACIGDKLTYFQDLLISSESIVHSAILSNNFEIAEKIVSVSDDLKGFFELYQKVTQNKPDDSMMCNAELGFSSSNNKYRLEKLRTTGFPFKALSEKRILEQNPLSIFSFNDISLSQSIKYVNDNLNFETNKFLNHLSYIPNLQYSQLLNNFIGDINVFIDAGASCSHDFYHINREQILNILINQQKNYKLAYDFAGRSNIDFSQYIIKNNLDPTEVYKKIFDDNPLALLTLSILTQNSQELKTKKNQIFPQNASQPMQIFFEKLISSKDKVSETGTTNVNGNLFHSTIFDPEAVDLNDWDELLIEDEELEFCDDPNKTLKYLMDVKDMMNIDELGERLENSLCLAKMNKSENDRNNFEEAEKLYEKVLYLKTLEYDENDSQIFLDVVSLESQKKRIKDYMKNSHFDDARSFCEHLNSFDIFINEMTTVIQQLIKSNQPIKDALKSCVGFQYQIFNLLFPFFQEDSNYRTVYLENAEDLRKGSINFQIYFFLKSKKSAYPNLKIEYNDDYNELLFSLIHQKQFKLLTKTIKYLYSSCNENYEKDISLAKVAKYIESKISVISSHFQPSDTTDISIEFRSEMIRKIVDLYNKFHKIFIIKSSKEAKSNNSETDSFNFEKTFIDFCEEQFEYIIINSANSEIKQVSLILSCKNLLIQIANDFNHFYNVIEKDLFDLSFIEDLCTEGFYTKYGVSYSFDSLQTDKVKKQIFHICLEQKMEQMKKYFHDFDSKLIQKQTINAIKLLRFEDAESFVSSNTNILQIKNDICCDNHQNENITTKHSFLEKIIYTLRKSIIFTDFDSNFVFSNEFKESIDKNYQVYIEEMMARDKLLLSVYNVNALSNPPRVIRPPSIAKELQFFYEKLSKDSNDKIKYLKKISKIESFPIIFHIFSTKFDYNPNIFIQYVFPQLLKRGKIIEELFTQLNSIVENNSNNQIAFNFILKLLQYCVDHKLYYLIFKISLILGDYRQALDAQINKFIENPNKRDEILDETLSDVPNEVKGLIIFRLQIEFNRLLKEKRIPLEDEDTYLFDVGIHKSLVLLFKNNLFEFAMKIANSIEVDPSPSLNFLVNKKIYNVKRLHILIKKIFEYGKRNIAEKWSQILFQIVAQNAYVKEGLLALIEKGIDDPELRCNLLIQFNFTKEAIKCAKKNGLKQFLSLLEM